MFTNPTEGLLYVYESQKEFYENEKKMNNQKTIEVIEAKAYNDLKAELTEALAAIGHLRSILKDIKTNDSEHALSATSGYDKS